MAGALLGLALALSAGGSAVNAVGQVKAGKAAKKAGELEQAASESAAGISDYNAHVAELQAADAVTRGQLEEQRYRTQVRGIVAGQRAGLAGANVDVNSGSALDVAADAATLGELDALTIRTNAARQAWGFQVQAVDDRNRAKVTRQTGVAQAAAGREREAASKVAAVGTILGGGYSLIEAKYGFKR